MESGARAAISGYRKQALYTANLLTLKRGESRVLQPEGIEDLAVYHGDRLVQAVQVKAYSSPLKLSDLKPKKPDSFLRRILVTEETSTVELVSFGPLGSELLGVQNGDKQALANVTEKLNGHGYTPFEAEQILSRLSIISVDEQGLQEEVFNFLSKTVTAGDPAHAFDLLVWWMHEAAEKRLRITPQQLRDRLQAIGKYLAEREAHHREWFTTIRPLEESGDCDGRREELAQQYYRGAAARYSHITAGLDVRRETLLAEIEKSFSAGRQVVILHGASGEGKTSLALRFLHDYVPSEWRFTVKAIDDRRHAASVANALADHLHVVNAPIYLLVDVAPTDLEWVALIRELLDKPNVRILVAIREEDLARRRASNQELGFPADIALEFGLEEAKILYTKLERSGEALNAFPTFLEAWERFGGQGPLLEFVYLITQTESLRDVLAAQVQRLRDEVQAGQLSDSALRLLHICALTTSFEARLEIRPLAEHLNLANPSGILQRFEKEYLLRASVDQRHVEALHPVRSTLLAEILDDPAFASQQEIALEALQFVPEADLQIFLLYVFSRLPECGIQVQEELSDLQVSTWTGAAGVGRSLIWWGIRCYQDDNRHILNEAELLAGDAWRYFMHPDITGAGASDPSAGLLDSLRSINPKLIGSLEELRGRLPPTRRIFDPLAAWLSNCRITDAPSSDADWAGIAELFLWSGRLSITPPGTLSVEDIPVESLPIELLADLSAGLYESLPTLYSKFQDEYSDTLRDRFRRETRTLVLDDSGDELFAHFIVPFEAARVSEQDAVETAGDSRESESRFGLSSDSNSQGRTQSLNETAVDRASLLRSLFPDRERFSTQGYGHQITSMAGGFELPYDESHKAMPRTALLLNSLVEVNSIFRTLSEYRCRPASWRQYAELLLDVREVLATTLSQLKRGLVTYFKRSQPYDIIGGRLTTEMWDRAVEVSKAQIYLPASAVDEWGFSSESKSKNKEKLSQRSTSVASSFAFRRHQPFKKAFQTYLSSASNFLQDAGVVCFCHSRWGRQVERKEEVIAAYAGHGYGVDKVRLSKHNLFELMNNIPRMQDAFDERLEVLVDQDRLQRIKRRESQLFPSLWALWFQFCHRPERRLRKAEVRAVYAFEHAAEELRNQLDDGLNVSESWSASVLNMALQWEGQSALVVQVNLKSIVNIEIVRAEVFKVLGEVLGGPEPGSLLQYARDYSWPHVLVVPTFNEMAVEAGCWVIPASVFFNVDPSDSFDRPWLHLLHQLSDEQMQELGLTAFGFGRMRESERLKSRFAEAGAIFCHMSNFIELIPQLDEPGEQILQEYLREPLKTLKECLIDIHELLPAVISKARELAGDNAELRESLVEPLEEIFKILDENDGEEIEIALSETIEHAVWFGELAGNTALLKWLEVPGSMEAFLRSVEDSDAGHA